MNEIDRLKMGVDGSGSEEIDVYVRGNKKEVKVKVKGKIKSGFKDELKKRDVGEK